MRAPWLPIVLVFATGACDDPQDPCEVRELQTVWAPDQQHTAVVFARVCGGAAGTSTHVSVTSVGDTTSGLPPRARSGDAPAFWAMHSSGNTIALDPGGARLGKHGEVLVCPIWIDNTHLSLSFDSGARVLSQVSRVGPVEVSLAASAAGSPPP
jgi:hypothetical protein